jgi:hypothetical protein
MPSVYNKGEVSRRFDTGIGVIIIPRGNPPWVVDLRDQNLIARIRNRWRKKHADRAITVEE